MVTINSLKFTDEYDGVLGGFGSDQGAGFLMGVVGDKMWVEIKFHIAWSTQNVPMLFSIADSSIIRTDSGSFIQDEFTDGDTIVIGGAGANNGNYTIDSVTDSEIIVTSALSANGAFAATYIYGTTDVDWIDVYYNCIANGSQPTFQSLTDVNSQKLSNIVAIPDTGTVDLVPATKQYAWVDVPKGTAKLTGETTYGYPSYFQDFKVVFPFFIKPFFLVGQGQPLLDLFNKTGLTPPTYFADLECLKFLFQIDARYTQRDLSVYHTSGTQTKIGNTGWFNELLDGAPLGTSGITQFKLISTSYTDFATGYPVDTIDFEQKTNVEIILESPAGYDASTTVFLLNFCWLPNSPDIYQNKGLSDYTNDFGEPNDFRHLFLHDRARQHVGAATVNGDRFGTAYQVIKTVTSVVAIDIIIVTFIIDMGSKVKQILKDNINGRDYMIWITPQNNPIP